MRGEALLALIFVAGCGGRIDDDLANDAAVDSAADTRPDAPRRDANVTPGCCELSPVSCDCVVVGTLPDGSCSKVCYPTPFGWSRTFDERGCPKWNIPAGTCLAPVRCSGDATFCTAGCGAIPAEEYQPSLACRTSPATVGCIDSTTACSAALTCGVRLRDGALFRAYVSCLPSGFRECAAAERTTVMSSPPCSGSDAG